MQIFEWQLQEHPEVIYQQAKKSERMKKSGPRRVAIDLQYQIGLNGGRVNASVTS